MIYLVRDKTSDGQQFPLGRLLESLTPLLDDLVLKRDWIVTAVRGYGDDVCAMEDDLGENASIEVSSELVLAVAADPRQWFYDLRCEIPPGNVAFGVLDSGGLLFQGDEMLARQVLKPFEEISVVTNSENLDGRPPGK